MPVNEEGIVKADDFLDAITKDTILITLMTANNESGALQPVKEVGEICREKGILFHTDAAQAAGKVSITLDDSGIGNGVDMVTIVGHKVCQHFRSLTFFGLLNACCFLNVKDWCPQR